MDISGDKRKKALLLHYCGEEKYYISNSFTDAQKGIGATRIVSVDPEVTEPCEYEALKNINRLLHSKEECYI
jgi:hypothetical protein